MSDTALDVFIDFGVNLSRIRMDRDGLDIHAPRELFLSLVSEARELANRLPAWPFLRLPLPFRDLGASFSAAPTPRHARRDVELDRETIANGLTLYIAGSAWTLRLKDEDRAELLKMFDATFGRMTR